MQIIQSMLPVRTGSASTSPAASGRRAESRSTLSQRDTPAVGGLRRAAGAPTASTAPWMAGARRANSASSNTRR